MNPLFKYKSDVCKSSVLQLCDKRPAQIQMLETDMQPQVGVCVPERVP